MLDKLPFIGKSTPPISMKYYNKIDLMNKKD